MKYFNQNLIFAKSGKLLPVLTLFIGLIQTSQTVFGYNFIYDAGEFEGAVWKFEMTSKSNPRETLKGRFRVANNVIYQKATREDPKYSKVIGRNYPRKLKTRMVFVDFRAMAKNGKFVEGMKGAFWLDFNRLGHWSGTMIDGNGTHWNFKCVRFQE